MREDATQMDVSFIQESTTQDEEEDEEKIINRFEMEREAEASHCQKQQAVMNENKTSTSPTVSIKTISKIKTSKDLILKRTSSLAAGPRTAQTEVPASQAKSRAPSTSLLKANTTNAMKKPATSTGTTTTNSTPSMVNRSKH